MPRPERRPSPRLAALAAVLLLGGAAAADGPATTPAPVVPDVARRTEVLRIVDELRVEAAKIRGLAWKTEVPADLISREQLRANLEEMIREDLKPEEHERDVKLLRRLGLLREDEDPIEIMLSFLEKGVAGYFNPKTKRFYVIDGLTGEGQRPTILHELVHALEDQYVDLEKAQKALEKDGDRLFAFKCVIEGSAEHARLQYQKAHPEIARLAMREQATSASAGETRRILATVPALLILPTLLQYQTGPAFVGRAVGEDYVKGMERLFADAPVSQEQVLHPGKYLGTSRDLPRRISWPADLAATLGEGWKGHESGPVGELDFALWMDRWFGEKAGRLDERLLRQGRFWTKDAQAASQGWDGIWMQVFDRGGRPTGYALASAWDSDHEAGEAAEAVVKALRTQYGDAFRSEGWTKGEDAVRTMDFTGTYGPGRIEIRGAEVRAADGFPDGALDRLWPRLAAVTITRDEADTWTETSEVDAFAGTSWRSPEAGVGWKPVEGWTLGKTGATTAEGRHGDTAVRLEVRPGGLEQNLLPLVVDLKRRHPAGALEMQKAEELEIGTKGAARVRMDDGVGAPAADPAAPGSSPDGPAPAAAGPRMNREIYIVPLAERLLVIEFEGPTADWAAARARIDAFLGGLVFQE